MIKRSKKLLALFCLLSLGIGLVSCGNKDVSPSNNTNIDAVTKPQDDKVVDDNPVDEPIIEDTGTPLDADKVEINDDFEIHFLNVDNSECTLIKSKGKSMLIGGGNASNADYILKYLRAHGVIKLDYVLLTHWHQDDTGALPYILDNVVVDYLFLQEHGLNEDQCLDLKNKITEKKLFSNFVLSTNKSFKLGDIDATILNGGGGGSRDANESSLVVKMLINGKVVALMADTTVQTEEKLMKDIGDIDLLKVGLHGAGNSTSAKFLETTKPEIAVIQAAGTDNLPSKETIDRLNKSGAEVHRTDLEKEVVIKLDSNNNFIVNPK